MLTASPPAAGDATTLSDVSFVSGSKTISSSSYPFASADQNKVVILLGAGPSDENNHATALVTSIQSVSGGQATLVTAASQTNTGTCVFGTDDSRAFQAVVNAAKARAPNPCQIVIPAAGYIVNGQILARLAEDWDVTIVGDGLGATQIFATSGTGFLLIEYIDNPTRLRGARTTIRDMQILTPLAGSGGSLVAIQINGETLHGLHDRSVVIENVLVRSMPQLGTTGNNNNTPAYGFWDYGIILQGIWRPLLQNVIVTGQDGWLSDANTALDGNLVDSSWSFSMTCGILLDDSYAPELASCQVYCATRGIQMVSTGTPSGPEGLFFRDCTVDVCREGVYLQTLTEEPQATIRGGHINARDFDLGLFGKKLCMISDVLLYNLQTLPTSASLMPTGAALVADDDATIEISSIVGWNPAGGMGTIVDSAGLPAAEIILYGGVQASPPVLISCQRGQCSTPYSEHVAPATLYPGSMTVLAATLAATGTVADIPVLNTAGMPRVGAVLIDSEWFTYDNLSGHLPAGATPSTVLYNIARGRFGSAPAAHAPPALVSSSPADIMAAGSQVGDALATAIASFGISVTGCQHHYNAHPLRHHVRVQGNAYDVMVADGYHNAYGYAMAVDAQEETQSVAYSGSSSLTLSYDRYTTTSLPSNATASQICPALQALPPLAAVPGLPAVTCSGGPLGTAPVSVVFGGQYLPQLPLSGSSGVIVTRSTEGYGGGCRAKHNRYTSNVSQGRLLDPGITPIISDRARGALLYLANTQSVTNGTTPNTIAWDLAEHDSDGFWPGSANPDELVIPANAGINRVRVTAQAQWSLNDFGDRGIEISVDGAFGEIGTAQDTRAPDPASLTTMGCSTGVIAVRGGDVLRLAVWQTSGSAINLMHGPFTWIQLEVVEGS